MADSHAEIDEAAVAAMLNDDDGPVGEYLAELAARGADIARTLVPRDTGRMMETIGSELGRDHFDGTPRAWFSAGYEAAIPTDRTWAGGFPVIVALEAKPGYVWNRSPKGRKHASGTRRSEPFLTEALDALAEES